MFKFNKKVTRMIKIAYGKSRSTQELCDHWNRTANQQDVF